MPNGKNELFIDEPMTPMERYLHAQVVRLDALCHMMSSIVEHLASKEGIAVEENKVKESAPRKKRVKE